MYKNIREVDLANIPPHTILFASIGQRVQRCKCSQGSNSPMIGYNKSITGIWPIWGIHVCALFWRHTVSHSSLWKIDISAFLMLNHRSTTDGQHSTKHRHKEIRESIPFWLWVMTFSVSETSRCILFEWSVGGIFFSFFFFFLRKKDFVQFDIYSSQYLIT